MYASLKKNALLNFAICAVSLSYGFLDWLFYQQAFLSHPETCAMSLHGGLDAPLQYRIGVWILACGMHTWLHASVWLALTLIDVTSLGFVLYCLVGMLRENPLYASLPRMVRFLSVVGMFFLVEYYIIWGHWYQYPSTLPSCLFVCISALLISGNTIKNRRWASLLLVGLSCIQGLVRADVAVVLHAGFFLATCLPFTKNVPLGRLWQATTSLLAALLAGCMQLYVMWVRFPNARYGTNGVFQLSNNLHPMQWMTALLALFPFWLLLWLLAKRVYRPDGVTTLLLVSTFLYILVWYMAGRLREVRIFLPFGIALLPATSLALSAMLNTEP